jgi:hypothetical protein
MTDLSAQRPIRVLPPDEIEQMLASHRLYLETDYHEGHRANFASVDLSRRDFSGLNLRGIKMDRALLRGADFTAADLRGANLDRSNVAGGALRPSGSIPGPPEWREPRFGKLGERLPRQGRDGVRGDGQRGLAGRPPASG